MPNNWKCFEAIPGFVAMPAVWRACMAEDFERLKTLCLEPSPRLLARVPCPRNCGCNHFVILRHDRAGAIAACCCEPATCPDIPLSIADITPLQLSWSRLRRAICQAFGLDAKTAKLPLHATIQVGSWSADAVPVILTVQTEPVHFRHIIAELTARLRQKFILFAPTAQHFDATCQELLANVNAAFFPLDAHATLTETGTLLPRTTPGEIFARFTPQPKEMDEDAARRAFALLQQLDSEGPRKPPSALTVFRLYCIEELSAAQIAVKCHCSKAAVVSRLKLIRAKTGVSPQDLRRLSSHLDKLEADLTDPRASHIHRKRLTQDEENDSEA